MLIIFLPLGAAFGAVSGFPGDAVHRAALRSQVPLLEIPKHHIILNSMCNCLLKNMTSDFMIINQSINQSKKRLREQGNKVCEQ